MRVPCDRHVAPNAAFHAAACAHKIEGIVSKQLDTPYKPGEGGTWRKTKCMNSEEFVIIGFRDPEGSWPHIGAILLGYYDEAGKLHDAGRGGSGMTISELSRLSQG
jgi:bifunctional non-homologous end joining protein LigD